MVWDAVDPDAAASEGGPGPGAPARHGRHAANEHVDDGTVHAHEHLHDGAGHVHPHDHLGHVHTGDQTRGRILRVALELIADRGYAATSTREIAEQLGFTKAALYYHFRTKDDLLGALVSPVATELEALIARAAAAGPAERRALVVDYVDVVGRHAHLIRVLASDPAVKESAGLGTVIPLFRRLVPLLAGTDAPDTAQRTRARAALTAVHGAIVHAQPGDDPEVVRATAIAVALAALGLGTGEPDKEVPAGSDVVGGAGGAVGGTRGGAVGGEELAP